MRRRNDLWQYLEIELEDAGDQSWWSGLMAPVAPGSGNAYLRFVGRVWSPDGKPTREVVHGETFPRFVDPEELDPADAFTPGWEQALAHLRRWLEAEGWVPAGRGAEAWAYRYVRPVVATQRLRRGA